MPVSKRTEREAVAEQLAVEHGPLPYWRSACGRATVYVGDCREVMAAMGADQFHAVCTDPPYGLEFMGQTWDAPWKNGDGGVDARSRRASEMVDPIKAKYLRHNVEYVRDSQKYQEWFAARADAMLRVAKPGAHLLSFGGTRMWHRMASAVEDAGWEIRDTVMWVYGSGFPKSHDVSKAIDKVLGMEREVVGEKKAGMGSGKTFGMLQGEGDNINAPSTVAVTAPATEEAGRWDGWGTALKPAYEPIILARKPPGGTVARCVMENGCGGLNIDGCRVGTTGEDVTRQIQSKTSSGSGVYQFNTGDAGSQSMQGGFTKTHKDGRWPANLVHDGSDEVVALFPQTGPSSASVMQPDPPNDKRGTWQMSPRSSAGVRGHDDQGGSAARFFYTAKADGDDRPHGRGATSHPTVKPLDLMRWLVRLVCAPGGVVLDPFMGSGSTGVAALLEGMRFVGIEQSQEYADLAVGRLKLALRDAPPVGEVVTGGEKVTEERREGGDPLPVQRMRGV